jgi:GH25 family lysozyme M1 (1,4-beta-N-acetylmuramidase)
MIKSLQVIRKVWLLNMMKKFIGKLIIIFITTITLTGCGSLDNNAVSAMDEALSIESETTIPVIVREDNIKTDNQEQTTQLETQTNSELETELETLSQTETKSTALDDISDSNLGQGNGAAVDVSEIANTNTGNENSNISLGIDVSRYQGTIDWKQVADAGISFAMIRVGYREDSTRTITADSNAKYNMQEAQKNNIKVGVYFYSTATTQDEAIEEAKWVTNYISQYKITFPVAYDCESYKNSNSVTYNLLASKRTDIALAFLNQISKDGYTPMFYASSSELNNDWETSRISKSYKIWVSQYPQTPFPQTTATSYTGTHAMWQYTNNGTIAGISKPVDVNVAYFGYDQISDAHSEDTPDEVEADVEALMNFTEVNEVVTAKDKTNLRDKPSQGSDSNIIYTLTNGETVVRTGISSSGWSRIILNDQTLYAVSNFLTTDLTTKQASNITSQQSEQDGSGSGDGLKTKFTECNDVVTAKIEVNLRTLPSVTNPDATVVMTLHNGEYVTRTGINTQYGWSRVEVDGQTLYCVSSYLTTP